MAAVGAGASRRGTPCCFAGFADEVAVPGWPPAPPPDPALGPVGSPPPPLPVLPPPEVAPGAAATTLTSEDRRGQSR